MKTSKFKMMLAGVFALVSMQAQAQDFGGKNGGDVLELQFKNIANDIQNWILKGGAKALKLPANVSLEIYSEKMMNALSAYNVSFTTDKIEVNGAEKQCENVPVAKLIRCNVDRFPKNESDQYVLVHHEYAGIAGLEENNGSPESNYAISDQITSSLEKVSVLKLAVKNKDDSGSYRDLFLKATSMSLGEFLNVKDPVQSKKDYAFWKCTAESGKQFDLVYRAEDYSDLLTGDSYYFSDNERTKTLTGSSYFNRSAYFDREVRNYLFIKKINSSTIVMENSYISDCRTNRKNKTPSESVSIPARNAQFSVCTVGGKN